MDCPEACRGNEGRDREEGEQAKVHAHHALLPLPVCRRLADRQGVPVEDGSQKPMHYHRADRVRGDLPMVP